MIKSNWNALNIIAVSLSEKNRKQLLVLQSNQVWSNQYFIWQLDVVDFDRTKCKYKKSSLKKSTRILSNVCIRVYKSDFLTHSI